MANHDSIANMESGVKLKGFVGLVHTGSGGVAYCAPYLLSREGEEWTGRVVSLFDELV